MGDCEGKGNSQPSQIWITSRDHSETHRKWRATENLIVEYLEWLYSEIAGGCPCVLILNVYLTHRTQVVVNAARERDVELLFMRAGGTSEYQPLNYRIFGELKSRARAEITRLMTSVVALTLITIKPPRSWRDAGIQSRRVMFGRLDDCLTSRNLEPIKEQSHSIIFMSSSLAYIIAISGLPGATTCVGVTGHKAVDGNIKIWFQDC
jgi:hypothetical protein